VIRICLFISFISFIIFSTSLFAEKPKTYDLSNIVFNGVRTGMSFEQAMDAVKKSTGLENKRFKIKTRKNIVTNKEEPLDILFSIDGVTHHIKLIPRVPAVGSVTSVVHAIGQRPKFHADVFEETRIDAYRKYGEPTIPPDGFPAHYWCETLDKESQSSPRCGSDGLALVLLQSALEISDPTYLDAYNKFRRANK